MTQNDVKKYLPLTETTYYILLALVEPLHGYAAIKKISQLSEGVVNVGAGTMYNALSNLLQENLIFQVGQDARRKMYQLTARGQRVLRTQVERLAHMAGCGQEALTRLETE
ncbi:MAG: helix-turn-helix transcriptional regulator [Anaerolineae bacterium]|nr:helix-turn-helix transcriptional regulator [Anaerolineae bacterium]